MEPDEAARLGEALQQAGLLTDAASLDPGDVVSLDGGRDSHTSLVRCRDRAVVVKLNAHTLEAEAAALRVWRAHTSRVPEVLAAGTLAGSPPVKYLVVEAMLGDGDDVVETADSYLQRFPARAGDVGRALGEELHLLHQARGDAFGNFADAPGGDRSYSTWGAYLHDFFEQHVGYVRELGVGDRRVERVRAFIRHCPPVDAARYLHGDVTVRNIAVRSHDPLQISLFDPNPVCGDPSWDIAPITNKVEYGERRERSAGASSETLSRNRDLLAGFREAYPGDVSKHSLLAAQLVQAVLQAEAREAAEHAGRFDERDVEVTREQVHDLMDRMAT